ncbi:YheC/YheD family endospore coat-associated protein [Paenibacillus sp. DMB20]|uniref:YheC/YheD family endospore coat-associated protein n=1 Tax=Paenibacillus sp. DMB20 TaxID=1642570 RepID=UPI000627B1E2|nr:YheC/YheD family protein [Paenibacillus sp. DMB20]KKO54260.1 hypothetical protein XI25_09470 [Paenibacillus sp. DMB20]
MQLEYVGILFNDSTHRGIPSGKTGTESVLNYEGAANSFGLVPCYFRLQDISLEAGTAVAYIRNSTGYIKATVPIPRAIHNRAFYRDRGSLEKIQQLISRGIFIYNAQTRYGKDTVHHMLQEDPLIRPALPDTVRADPVSIRSMIQRHGDLVLKPCRGSVGLGIMRLCRGEFHDYFTFSRSSPSARGWRTVRLPKDKLPLLLRARIRRVPFLAQQRIPLAQYRGRPYDVRITVQRGLRGEWEVTGMFAKTSPPRTFVSNIAQGGSAYPAHDIFRDSIPGISPDQMIERTAEFTIRTAQSLSRHMPFAADFGIDAGITGDGRLFFIECNGRDQRYGFREAGLEDVWKETYRKPMAFARYLIETGSWPL